MVVPKEPPPFDLIAEIGINHNGSESRAWNLLHSAIDAGVNAVSFQVREKNFYDGKHARKNQLSEEFYMQAFALAKEKEIRLGVAIADRQKIRFFSELGASFWKTLSWDLNNSSLQRDLEGTGKPTFVSTGMTSMDEIIQFSRKFSRVRFIHTQLTYELSDVNLKAIETIRNTTGCPVAFGLHSKKIEILYMAAAFQPDGLFFYIKDDSEEEHPDDSHAIPLNDLPEVVENLQDCAVCIGTGEKDRISNYLHPPDDSICR
jgi:sialic acid synthase SpsE